MSDTKPGFGRYHFYKYLYLLIQQEQEQERVMVVELGLALGLVWVILKVLQLAEQFQGEYFQT